jgi:hypothetical protein
MGAGRNREIGPANCFEARKHCVEANAGRLSETSDTVSRAASSNMVNGDRDIELRPGARVRLSALGKIRSPRIKFHTGVIVNVTDGSDRVRVLWDGRKAPVTIHSSYIELEAEQPSSNWEPATSEKLRERQT